MADERPIALADAVNTVMQWEKHWKHFHRVGDVVKLAHQLETEIPQLQYESAQLREHNQIQKTENETLKGESRQLTEGNRTLASESANYKKIIAEGQEVEQRLPERKAELSKVEKGLAEAREAWAKFRSTVGR